MGGASLEVVRHRVEDEKGAGEMAAVEVRCRYPPRTSAAERQALAAVFDACYRRAAVSACGAGATSGSPSKRRNGRTIIRVRS